MFLYSAVGDVMLHDAFTDHLAGRRDFGEDLLDIHDLNQLTVHLGDSGQIMIFTCPFGWRMDIAPVHIDDTLHRPHQESLSGAIVFSIYLKAIVNIRQGAAAARQDHDHVRYGAAADVGNPPPYCAPAVYAVKRGAL